MITEGFKHHHYYRRYRRPHRDTQVSEADLHVYLRAKMQMFDVLLLISMHVNRQAIKAHVRKLDDDQP